VDEPENLNEAPYPAGTSLRHASRASPLIPRSPHRCLDWPLLRLRWLGRPAARLANGGPAATMGLTPRSFHVAVERTCLPSARWRPAGCWWAEILGRHMRAHGFKLVGLKSSWCPALKLAESNTGAAQRARPYHSPAWWRSSPVLPWWRCSGRRWCGASAAQAASAPPSRCRAEPARSAGDLAVTSVATSIHAPTAP